MKRIIPNLLGALAVCAVLNLQLTTALAQGTGFTLLTITNPTPADHDFFGAYVAVLGTDRVLIGAHLDDTGATDAGAAYLFSTNGTLLTTFTNPMPAYGDYFGAPVAALGTDRLLIGAVYNDTGAPNSGAAYLFSTNGTLLATFTSPTPAYDDHFGCSVAAVGIDRVLIGAVWDNTGAPDAGAVYLFTTGGVFLTVFTNPLPAFGDWFGYSVAAARTDRVLIGTPGAPPGGAAYLFSLNGALLATYTNPSPASSAWFGCSVVAVGADRVLIGASLDNAGATNGGAAYLFSTSGTLLTMFTNPTPAYDDHFGWPVVAVGTDRILIGASQDDTGAGDAGAAYLFSTNGTLLNTFTNPAPAVGDLFGYSLAAAGSDRLLIGAFRDDTGAGNAGVAYLFSAATPSLTILLTPTNTVTVSWPSPSVDWVLQQNTNSVAAVNWSNAPATIQDDGATKTLIVNPPTGIRFYRLFKL